MKDFMLIVHLLGLTMGVGTSIGFVFLRRATKGMEKDEALKFTLNSFALSKMGHTGLMLLLISGFYLITPYWKDLSTMPLLIIKLVLVAILMALLGIIGRITRKARQSEPLMHLKKMAFLGPAALLVSISIVVLAVMTFH